jgi:hypothetical protein
MNGSRVWSPAVPPSVQRGKEVTKPGRPTSRRRPCATCLSQSRNRIPKARKIHICFTKKAAQAHPAGDVYDRGSALGAIRQFPAYPRQPHVAKVAVANEVSTASVDLYLSYLPDSLFLALARASSTLSVKPFSRAFSTALSMASSTLPTRPFSRAFSAVDPLIRPFSWALSSVLSTRPLFSCSAST